MTGAPADRRALVAVDLGAESCRVSLLRWVGSAPRVVLVHRFANAPQEIDGHLRWDLASIEAGLDEGLRRCAEVALEGVRSIAVDGWAVGILSAIAMSARWRRSGRCIGDVLRSGCAS
jgi:rhamnulokinase